MSKILSLNFSVIFLHPGPLFYRHNTNNRGNTTLNMLHFAFRISNIFSCEIPTLELISNYTLILLALVLIIKGKKSPSIRLNNTIVLFCYAVLSALAARRWASWYDIHFLLSITALPILSQYSVGYYPFQLANIFGIYKAINRNSSGIGHAIISTAIHVYLLFASMDKQNLEYFTIIKQVFLYTEEIRLVKIQNIRDVVFDDIKKLPERMRLCNSVNKFVYDVNEPLFILRAITKMMWRPMLPLYLLSVIKSMLPIFISATYSKTIYFIGLSSEHSWYSGIMYVIIGFVLYCVFKLCKVEVFAAEQTNQAISTLKLHLFRLPLSNKGLQKDNINYITQHNVDNMLEHLNDAQHIVSCVAGSISAFIPLYSRTGWLALIPLSVALITFLLNIILINVTDLYFHQVYHNEFNHDDKVDNIYHNIKSIKMFGWEKMYIDPKIQKYWKKFDKDRIPWYVPIVRFTWMAYCVFFNITGQLSSFLLIYLYLQKNSESSQLISVVDMLWMSDIIVTMQNELNCLMSRLYSFCSFIEIIYKVEKSLKGNYINTLPHYPIDIIKAQNGEHEASIDYSKSSISIYNGEFSWNKDDPILTDISISVNQGELVAVVGKTGSGKSSLLLSICGEVEMTGGTGAVVGSMALVEQTPWIMSGTLRENILFGQEYDEEYYKKVIYACALTEDINNWINKDLTLIGERGINISGGQKARLALARAVYSRADIYILDDPLSAVDAHVKRHILDHVIMDTGILAGKIRIMSVNTNNILPYFDKVLTLNSSRKVSVSQNTREDYQLFAAKSDVVFDNGDICSKFNNDGNSNKASNPEDDTESKIDKDSHAIPETAKKHWCNWDDVKFVLKICGGPTLAIILFSAILSPVSQFILNGYTLDALRNMQGTSNITSDMIQRYLFIEIFKETCTSVIPNIESYVNEIVSEKYLNPQIKSIFIERLIHAPLSFFDSTTRQEISSAYNNGNEAISKDIPVFLGKKIADIVNAILSIYRVGTSIPQVLIFVPMLLWANIKYETASTPVRSSLEKIETQLLIDQEKVDDIIVDGKRLIRIFNVENYFTARYMEEKDNMHCVQLPQHSIKLFLRSLYCIHNSLVYSLCEMFALIHNRLFSNKVSSVELDTYISLVNTLADGVENIISLKADALSFKNRIAKFRQYIDMDGEKMFVENATKPENLWPSVGKIEFRDFSMKYHDGLELVLKNVNLTIKPGEKIGIVGRTGAGKTSLTRALFRLVNNNTCKGSIVIDGQDIFSLNIGDLRPKLGIIPQEPTMFKGTFRQNLDPLVKHSVEDMWSAIIKCGIVEHVQPPNACEIDKDHIDKDKLEEIKDWDEEWKGADWSKRLFLYLFITKPRIYKAATQEVRPHGLNRFVGNWFSDGQQQLFGLCRLLMRNRKVVVLDEATANVDLETDQHMQKLIRSEFKDCTVLTIAHRLETIMNSDRVIVLDSGRVAEIGPPAELLEKNGHFAELARANDFGQ